MATLNNNVSFLGAPNVKLSNVGGYGIMLINKTGVASVKGEIVKASLTTSNGFYLNTANFGIPIGVVGEAGVGDGSYCLVITSGIAEVLLTDSTASTTGSIVCANLTRATALTASMNTVGQIQQIGVALETLSGGTNVLCKCMLNISCEQNVRSAGVVGNGTSDDYTALNTLITAIGSTPGTIKFPRGTYKLSTSITFPSNIVLEFGNGAILSPDSAKIVTINGEIKAGLYRIFTGAGTISGSPLNNTIYPDWFGITHGASGENTASLQAAINLCPTNGIVECYTPSYIRFTSTVHLKSNMTLKGCNGRDSYETNGTFYYDNTTGAAFQTIDVLGTPALPKFDIQINDLIITGKAATDTSIGFLIDCQRLKMENVTIKYFGTGVKLTTNYKHTSVGDPDNNNVENDLDSCNFYYCGTGLNVTSNNWGQNTDGFVTRCIFASNTSRDAIFTNLCGGWTIHENHFYSAGAVTNLQIVGELNSIQGNYFEDSVNQVTLVCNNVLGWNIISGNRFMTETAANKSIKIYSLREQRTLIISNNVARDYGSNLTATLIEISGVKCVTVASYLNRVITLTQQLTVGEAAALVGKTIIVDHIEYTVEAATSGVGSTITIVETPDTELVPVVTNRIACMLQTFTNGVGSNQYPQIFGNSHYLYQTPISYIGSASQYHANFMDMEVATPSGSNALKLTAQEINLLTGLKNMYVGTGFNPPITVQPKGSVYMDYQLGGLYKSLGSGSWTELVGIDENIYATAPTSKTWTIGMVFRYTDPVGKGYVGGVCSVVGTAGNLVGVTGAIGTSSATLTVNSATDLIVGQYITIVGVTGVKKITVISGTTVTLDTVSNATVTGAAVAFSTPTFVDYGALKP